MYVDMLILLIAINCQVLIVNLNNSAVLILFSPLMYPKIIFFGSNWLVIWLPFPSFNDYKEKASKLPAS